MPRFTRSILILSAVLIAAGAVGVWVALRGTFANPWLSLAVYLASATMIGTGAFAPFGRKVLGGAMGAVFGYLALKIFY